MRRLSLEEVKRRVYDTHGDQVELIDWTYQNTWVRCVFIDDLYGAWSSFPKHIWEGQKHPVRSRVNSRTSLDEIKQRLKEKHDGSVELLEWTYINQAKKAMFLDYEFGVWSASPQNVLNGTKHPMRGQNNRLTTFQKRYGVSNPMQIRDVQLKVNSSRMNAFKIEHWRTKEKLVCLAHYEVAFVNWANFNQIDFDWQVFMKTELLTRKLRKSATYCIDAFIKSGEFSGLWVEIKGFFRKDSDDQRKWEWFHSKHPTNSQLWNRARLEELGILVKGKPNPLFVQ